MSEKPATEYYLVADAAAETVEAMTGLRGHNTTLGALIEKPRPFDLDRAMDQIDRAMHPNRLRCICGSRAILHQSNCPMALAIT